MQRDPPFVCAGLSFVIFRSCKSDRVATFADGVGDEKEDDECSEDGASRCDLQALHYLRLRYCVDMGVWAVLPIE